jgi:hypothetical protein
MTMPSGGALSMSALNTEFGRTSTLQLSLSQSYAGTFAQYGAINRNTASGQYIYTQNLVGSSFQLGQFYSYNDTESNYWYWTFNNNSYDYDIYVRVVLASNDIYGDTVASNSFIDSGGYVDTGGSATTGNDLDLQLVFPVLGTLNVLVEDPDTLATIYTATGVSMNDYKGLTNLATVYGYQRLNFTLTFFN